MNIFLIRHGEKEFDGGNIMGMKLTDKGHRQADLAGKRLKDFHIDIIFSSTMTRARQTADEVNKYINVPVEYRDELREIDMGEYDKNSWEYVKEKYPEFARAYKNYETDIPYPNGECGEDVWNRSKKVLNEITNSKFENIAVVTHGGTISCIICGILDLPQAKRFSFGSPVEHCGITHIKYTGNRYNIHTFNDYFYLGKEV